jgi:hypothetical protein
MTKKNNCKVCGKPSGKMKTCKKCKEDFPYKLSGEKGRPFDRKKLFLKSKNSEVKDE